MSKAPLGNLYNLRLLAPNHFAIAKFDSDFNVEAVYELHPKGTGYTCNCPASARTVKLKPCKHQRMLPLMMGAVNTNRFYNPDNGSWCEPLAMEDAVRDQAELSASNSPSIPASPQPDQGTPHPPAQVTEALNPPPPPPTSRPVVTRRI